MCRRFLVNIMWKLVSDTLPTEKAKRIGAPVATVYATDTLAPVCRLAVVGESFSLPTPEPVGNYYYIQLPDADIEVLGVQSLELSWMPEVNSYWYSFLEARAISTSPVTISAVATVLVPVHSSDYLYRLDLSDWGNINITNLNSEGMDFFPAVNPNNLQHPEWVFIDGILNFKGESLCAPRVGGELEITFNLTVDTPLYKVSKFQFPETVRDCELIEYLGFNYKVTANRFPSKYQFIWNYVNHTAYIFN